MIIKGVFLWVAEMDYQSLIHLMTSKTLVKKVVAPFILSVSVFSFIFSNPSWHAFLFRFFKFYFSSLPMQVLSHAMDKTWIFLICNGILVVIGIANTSGMVQSPSGFDLNDQLEQKIGDDILQAPPPDTKDNSLELDNAVFSELEGEEKLENDATEKDKCLILDDDEEEEQLESEFSIREGRGEETQEPQISCIMGDHEEKNEEESETCFMMEEEEDDHEELYEDDEEGEEGFDELSTEELNKKFDDFIRKMKEDLRIQAQQQLVLVK